MSEIERLDSRVKVARDLSEILSMTALLDDQAEHKANAKIDGTGLPGGMAMVALAPVANLEAWTNRLGTAERSRGDVTAMLQDEDDAWEPPLQTLCFWSEDWRREHGSEYGLRPTVATEAAFIRWALDWAWSHELRWDDFCADIRRARVRLENVLYAGNRVERTRIQCNQCDPKPRLVRIYGNAHDGSEDYWKCPGCKHRYDDDGVRKAHASMLRSQGAEKWVHQIDAIGTLKVQGRPERTIRQWLSEGEGLAYCDPVTHEVWVWWPDLWRKHVATPTRKRESA